MDDSRAPWNEKENQERTFNVEVDCTLSNNRLKVTTQNYATYECEDWFSCEIDDDDAKSLYEEQHYTVQELLNELKQYIKKDLKACEGNKSMERSLNRMLADCEGWITIETEVTTW